MFMTALDNALNFPAATMLTSTRLLVHVDSLKGILGKGRITSMTVQCLLHARPKLDGGKQILGH